MKASDNEFPSVLFDEQATKPTTPATGFWRAYAKADGLYIVDDAGVETGPLGTGGGSTGMTKLDQANVSGSAGAVQFSSISQGHRDLLITGLIQTATFTMRVGTSGTLDTGSNYEYGGEQFRTGTEFDEAAQAQTTLKFARNVPSGSDERANYASPLHLIIPGYTNTTFYKMIWAQSAHFGFSATDNMRINVQVGTWRNSSSPIDIIEFTSLNVGSEITLYGLG
jgi:hypothetical protein